MFFNITSSLIIQKNKISFDDDKTACCNTTTILKIVILKSNK